MTTGRYLYSQVSRRRGSPFLALSVAPCYSFSIILCCLSSSTKFCFGFVFLEENPLRVHSGFDDGGHYCLGIGERDLFCVHFISFSLLLPFDF